VTVCSHHQCECPLKAMAYGHKWGMDTMLPCCISVSGSQPCTAANIVGGGLDMLLLAVRGLFSTVLMCCMPRRAVLWALSCKHQLVLAIKYTSMFLTQVAMFLLSNRTCIGAIRVGKTAKGR
jgi:hypothetical protein